MRERPRRLISTYFQFFVSQSSPDLHCLGGDGSAIPAGTSSCLLVSGNWKPSSVVVNVTLTWAISGSKAVAPTIFESILSCRELMRQISADKESSNGTARWQLGNFSSLATPAPRLSS